MYFLTPPVHSRGRKNLTFYWREKNFFILSKMYIHCHTKMPGCSSSQRASGAFQ